MIRRPPRSTPLYSSAASDVYKRQVYVLMEDAKGNVFGLYASQEIRDSSQFYGTGESFVFSFEVRVCEECRGRCMCGSTSGRGRTSYLCTAMDGVCWRAEATIRPSELTRISMQDTAESLRRSIMSYCPMKLSLLGTLRYGE
eukprot:TRINITY_DN9554_c0_g1_i2.p1 TRINITY_DN9554_c0_g1~~TRINITY_DN9554_c0_g1_i2.p1  ORF type:complete len:151 (-),score=6.54 TRINITY_DN9554_c0_g1_i2:127-552(-)